MFKADSTQHPTEKVDVCVCVCAYVTEARQLAACGRSAGSPFLEILAAGGVSRTSLSLVFFFTVRYSILIIGFYSML